MKKLEHIIEQHDTDKNTCHSYAAHYDKLFTRLRDSATDVLEIGVNHGGSVRTWLEYFRKATIYGVDINIYKKPKLDDLFDNTRVNLYEGNAYSDSFLENFRDIKFDIMIDDGSHKARDMKYFVSNYLRFLKPGGILIVEDVKHSHRKKLNNFLKSCLPVEARDKSYFLDIRHERGRSKCPNNILFVYSEN
tara:strand:+ start:1873 stop:2445 length:573 start_codon:yes stop_codon:yes gene_type:complete